MSAMPLANKDYTFYQIPVPRAYRNLPRRKRVTIELLVGVAVLVLFAIAVSVQMPRWLQIAGWMWFLVYWVGWMALFVRSRRRRHLRERSAPR
jgi:hypothetical protein